MIRKLLFSCFLFSISSKVSSQVGIGTTTPQGALDIVSTSSGLMIPRMTEADKLDISSPGLSSLIFQTDGDVGIYVYNGSSWLKVIYGEIDAEDVNFDSTTSTASFTGNNLKEIVEDIDKEIVFKNLSTNGFGVVNRGLNSPSESEVAFGQHNTSYAAISSNSFIATDRIFSVGIGMSSSNNADALEIFKNGKLYADELDLSEITDSKQLVTKEYVDNAITSAGSSSTTFSVGDSYLGGIVFYTWDNGNHGLVVAHDEFNGAWDLTPYASTKCKFRGIGAGELNTNQMFNANLDSKSSTFLSNNSNEIQKYQTFYDLDGDGATERIGGWYVPSPMELIRLIQTVSTGVLSSSSTTDPLDYGTYWSSRENYSNSDQVKAISYTNMGVITVNQNKNTSHNVRLVKQF